MPAVEKVHSTEADEDGAERMSMANGAIIEYDAYN